MLFGWVKAIFSREQHRKDVAEALQNMKDFADGVISIDNFYRTFQEKKVYQDLLIHDKTRIMGYYAQDKKTGRFILNKKLPSDYNGLYSPEYFLTHPLISLNDKYEFYGMVRRYFWRRGDHGPLVKNEELKSFELMLKAQPKWICVRDENFLHELERNCPTESNRFKWYKQKYLELFRYERTPPEWVQSPEWPIVNGQPLVFKQQKEDGELVQYLFYQPQTLEETIVEQYY